MYGDLHLDALVVVRIALFASAFPVWSEQPLLITGTSFHFSRFRTVIEDRPFDVFQLTDLHLFPPVLPFLNALIVGLHHEFRPELIT
jgi:hypothetical protein